MLLTKLHIPTSVKNQVLRTKIFAKLNEGLFRKIILVSAPAGYGKTTTITQWIRKNRIPTAWFSIDKRDNSLYEFYAYLISSIQTMHADVGKKSLGFLKLPGTVEFDHIIELLINDLLKIEHDFLLVLDDFHFINDEKIMKSLSLLIEFKPKHFHIAIVTRSDPALPIAKFRSQNEIIEIRSADLSFSKKDVSDFFNKKLNLDISSKEIKLLDKKIEGWIAGLQLVALTIRGKKNISEYIEKIAGDNRYIMDYLVEEALTIQNDELRTFLLFTSILENFNGSLCDSILQIKNSQTLIESLEKNNLFIVPLDNERKWYRYHHLFSDLLKKQLTIKHKEKIQELHKKASIWFENNKMPLLAIEHALAANDRQGALQKINSIIEHLRETSQNAAILKFGSCFSKEEIFDNKNFAINYAWSLIIVGNLTTGENYLYQLENSTKDKKLLGRIYATYILLKVFSGDVEAAFNYSQLAIDNIADKDIIWKTWAFISKGESHLLRFELEKSVQSLQKASQNATILNNPNLKMVADSKTAYVLRLMGRYREAYNVCKNLLISLSQVNDFGAFSMDILSSLLYSIIGLIQIERNHIEKGLNNALKGYELSRKVTSPAFKGYGSLMLAESYYKVGDINQALKTLEGLEGILDKNVAQWLSVLGYSLQCKLLTLKGEMKAAEKLHAQREIQFKHHAFEKYFYEISFARFLIAKHKYDEAIGILKKLSIGLERDNAFELLIEVELLKSKAFVSYGLENEALQSITKTLHLAQSESFIRIFICEGETIEKLLKDILKEKQTRRTDDLDGISKEYLNKIITAFKLEKKLLKKNISENLSGREIEVLKLLSNQLSNNEISENLYISLSTVKTHISHILSKLDAKNRQEATEIALEKGII